MKGHPLPSNWQSNRFKCRSLKCPNILVCNRTALYAFIEGQASKLNMWAGVCPTIKVVQELFFEWIEIGKVYLVLDTLPFSVLTRQMLMPKSWEHGKKNKNLKWKKRSWFKQYCTVRTQKICTQMWQNIVKEKYKWQTFGKPPSKSKPKKKYIVHLSL